MFAAGPLEIVLQLLLMSVVVRLWRRRWLGILIAAAALLRSTSATHVVSATLLVAMIVGNGLIGLAIGIIYAVYGVEFAMLGHAVAHRRTVAFW